MMLELTDFDTGKKVLIKQNSVDVIVDKDTHRLLVFDTKRGMSVKEPLDVCKRIFNITETKTGEQSNDTDN